MTRLSWNQPICDKDWQKLYPDGRMPYRLIKPEQERCAWCGESTKSGIYIRVDPKDVAYPAERPE